MQITYCTYNIKKGGKKVPNVMYERMKYPLKDIKKEENIR